ncbi:MAG: hypothetical protein M1499_08120 [Firmicutes bacterium]|nr:hypothetical protein [Bacillota bacterium]
MIPQDSVSWIPEQMIYKWEHPQVIASKLSMYYQKALNTGWSWEIHDIERGVTARKIAV